MRAMKRSTFSSLMYCMCQPLCHCSYVHLPPSSVCRPFRHKYFNVEPNTGKVYVTDSALIDREVSSLYSATLQARDTADKTGTTVLEIHLKDINDNAPFINRDSYMVFVEEGQQFELQIQVHIE